VLKAEIRIDGDRTATRQKGSAALLRSREPHEWAYCLLVVVAFPFPAGSRSEFRIRAMSR